MDMDVAARMARLDGEGVPTWAIARAGRARLRRDVKRMVAIMGLRKGTGDVKDR